MRDASFSGSATPTAVFRYKQRYPLHALFEPMGIAVIGATERPGSVERALLWNLTSHPFGGTVFPVNPKRSSVLGTKAYPVLAALPVLIDLAVIATPAPTVPGLVAECVQARVKGAIILSSGFQESGVEGVLLEQGILEQTRRGRLHILGPIVSASYWSPCQSARHT